ncbi:MAG: 50S ribosomal protein L9 [Methylophilaceae bacterium]|nr:50S ribosomal protein L9 [Methylophilaceae bacterium]
MQVILLEKVGKLGGLGDIVNVKNGFGRNYLIPQGKAKRATEANKTEFANRRAELEKQLAERLADAQLRSKNLNGFVLRMAQKVGVDGRLFGSVSALDIAEALGVHGMPINKSEVRLPQGALKMVGEYNVDIVLHHDVVTEITVIVVAE